MRPDRRAGLTGLAVLGLTMAPLAAPGTVVVPAAAGDGPGWLLGPYGDGLGLSGPVYYALLWVALISSTVVARNAAALGSRLIWGAILAGLAIFAVAPPLLSQDAFSYIAYARMSELYGANPYLFAPVELPYDAAFPYVGWPYAASAYGPLFSLGALPLASLGLSAALWSVKAAVALCVLGLVRVTARVAERRGIEPLGAASLVAFNPITLAHVVGGGHNDSVAMLVGLASILAVLAGRELAAGAGFALAAAIKVNGGIAAPFALIAARRRRDLLAGAALALALVAALTLPVFGASALESFVVLGDNQDLTTRLSIPRIVSNLPLISIEAARAGALVLYGVAVVCLLAWTARGGDWVRAAGWATLGLLLATSWILPWYLLWLLPLAAVGEDRPLLLATLGLCGLQLAYGVPWP